MALANFKVIGEFHLDCENFLTELKHKDEEDSANNKRYNEFVDNFSKWTASLK
jgi:hypothetical protein